LAADRLKGIYAREEHKENQSITSLKIEFLFSLSFKQEGSQRSLSFISKV
jgi:hypothetical protein